MTFTTPSISANFFDSLIEVCIIFLIIFMPLAFGGVGLGAQRVLITISGFIFLLWLAKSITTRQKITFADNVFTRLFIIFLAIIVLQLIPLPKFLLVILSPYSYSQYLPWPSISIYPDGTAIEFFKALSYGLLAFVILNSFERKPQLLRLLTVIAITGFAVACFGVIQKFTRQRMIYWIQPVLGYTGPFGLFVNKNHFAGFMELTIPITAAFIFISKELEKKLLFSFMVVVMLVALFLSVSRAGILGLFMGLIFIILLARLRHSFKRHIFLTLPVVFLFVFFILVTLKITLVEPFFMILEDVLWRANIYKDILGMFVRFPLFGVGIGAFGSIFNVYSSQGKDVIFTHGESDWFQFLAELGLVGFLCIAIFIRLFFKDILYSHFLGRGPCICKSDKDVGLRHDRFVLTIIMAGLVSLTSIILHGFVDINLHIPSNAMLACIIAGILIAVAHNSFRETTKQASPKI